MFNVGVSSCQGSQVFGLVVWPEHHDDPLHRPHDAHALDFVDLVALDVLDFLDRVAQCSQRLLPHLSNALLRDARAHPVLLVLGLQVCRVVLEVLLLDLGIHIFALKHNHLFKVLDVRLH